MKLRFLVKNIWERLQVVMARPSVPCFARSLNTFVHIIQQPRSLYQAPGFLSLSSWTLWAQTSAKRPYRHLSYTPPAIFSIRMSSYPTSVVIYLLPFLHQILGNILRLAYGGGFGAGAWLQKC